MNQVTHWIYYGDNVVTAVRGPADMDDMSVKCKALEWNLRVPLCDRPNECPGDKAKKIALGHVRRFYSGVKQIEESRS